MGAGFSPNNDSYPAAHASAAQETVFNTYGDVRDRAIAHRNAVPNSDRHRTDGNVCTIRPNNRDARSHNYR